VIVAALTKDSCLRRAGLRGRGCSLRRASPRAAVSRTLPPVPAPLRPESVVPYDIAFICPSQAEL